MFGIPENRVESKSLIKYFYSIDYTWILVYHDETYISISQQVPSSHWTKRAEDREEFRALFLYYTVSSSAVHPTRIYIAGQLDK